MRFCRVPAAARALEIGDANVQLPEKVPARIGEGHIVIALVQMPIGIQPVFLQGFRKGRHFDRSTLPLIICAAIPRSYRVLWSPSSLGASGQEAGLQIAAGLGLGGTTNANNSTLGYPVRPAPTRAQALPRKTT